MTLRGLLYSFQGTVTSAGRGPGDFTRHGLPHGVQGPPRIPPQTSRERPPCRRVPTRLRRTGGGRVYSSSPRSGSVTGCTQGRRPSIFLPRRGRTRLPGAPTPDPPAFTPESWIVTTSGLSSRLSVSRPWECAPGDSFDSTRSETLGNCCPAVGDSSSVCVRGLSRGGVDEGHPRPPIHTYHVSGLVASRWDRGRTGPGPRGPGSSFVLVTDRVDQRGPDSSSGVGQPVGGPLTHDSDLWDPTASSATGLGSLRASLRVSARSTPLRLQGRRRGVPFRQVPGSGRSVLRGTEVRWRHPTKSDQGSLPGTGVIGTRPLGTLVSPDSHLLLLIALPGPRGRFLGVGVSRTLF